MCSYIRVLVMYVQRFQHHEYLFTVEHYERKAVRYYDEGPQGEEELRVSSANRTQDYVKKAVAILEVCFVLPIMHVQ